jgi:hypothetical protein
MKPLQFNPDSAPFSRYLRSAGQVLWSIGIVLCVLLMGAEAALAVDLRWDMGFETWPAGDPGPITFTNVQGSGVDVRITHTFQAGGFESFAGIDTPISSNFVLPSGASPDTDNSLAIGINGPGRLPLILSSLSQVQQTEFRFSTQFYTCMMLTSTQVLHLLGKML